MLSNYYQHSGPNNPRISQDDPNNRLLWRANIRRLEFEPLRDSLLAIGGALDTNMYGRPVDLEKEPYSTRRSVYGFIDRSDVTEVLINFDFANPDLPTGRRHETTVPQQALFLMNSPLVVEQAKKLTTLAEFNACQDDAARVEFLYERIYQRPARSEEVKLGLEFVAQAPAPQKIVLQEEPLLPVSNDGKKFRPKQQGRKGGNNEPKQRPPLKAWEESAHALLQA